MNPSAQDLALSREFVDRICAAGEGALEKAAAATTEITRLRMREEAFSPNILPYDNIDNSMLDRAVNTEHPFMICEMEGAQFGSKTMNFNDTGDTAPFYANKYVIIFSGHTTPEWTKDLNLLRTYRSDVRSMIVDNALRDLGRMKDKAFMKLSREIVGPTPGRIAPGRKSTRQVQNVLLPGRLDRDNLVSAKKYLKQRALPDGIWLCNFVTWSEFERWTRNEMGGDFAQTLIKDGTKAFGKAEFSGIPFIVTLMTDLVGNGEIWQYTAPNYLGRAGVLEQPRMYLRKDKNIIRFSCREMIGCTIANTAGVQRVEFQDVANATGGDGQIIPA